MAPLSPELLKILACPVPECRGGLRLEGDAGAPPRNWLVCEKCGRRYRIEERFPVLIPEEAEPPAAPEPRGQGPA